MNSSFDSSINNNPDNSRYFSTAHLNENLKSTMLRGGVVTFIAQIIKFILQITSTMILARLLTPQDFGLIAMVSAVTGVILIFKDLGLSMATVQKVEITHEQVSTLFWINVALSAFLMLVTAGISPFVAWFYHDPRLLLVTIAIAGGFIFGGLTVQHQSLLSRQMKFKALAVIEISALLVGILTALACSWLGLKYWSLVFMNLASAFTAMAGSWIASGWLPGRPRKGSGVRPMLAFGGNLTIFSFVNYFARNLDNILIGKFVSPLQVGLYSKAYSLLLMPLTQISSPMASVAIPALSKLQNDPERYSNYYLKAVKLIAYIAAPLVVMMGILSKEIVLLVLGNQWQGAIPIFRILAVCAFCQPIGSTVGWIYISLGQTKRMAQWGIVACPIICFFIILGLHWGAIGVAIGYTSAILILIYPQFYFALKYSPIRTAKLIGVVYRPVLLGIFLALPMIIVKCFISHLSLVLFIATETICAMVVLPVFIYFISPFKKDIMDIYAIAKTIFISKERES